MSWLQVEDGSLVNLDHAYCVAIQDKTPKNLDFLGIPIKPDCRVVMYPANEESEPVTICQGSQSKCEDYIRALMELTNAKRICAVGEHRCGCDCGCQDMIRDDFEVCDECRDGYHWGSVRSKVRKGWKEDALKVKAA